MNRDCNQIQEEIVAVKGDVDGLDRDFMLHVRACDACGRVAENEARLASLLEAAVPQEDQFLQQHIIDRVRKSRMRRRVWSILPVAASLAIGVLGAAAMGGVPAGGLAAQLATGSNSSWMAMFSSLGGVVTALTTTMEALAHLVTPAIGLLATGGVLLGSMSMGKLSRRWKLQPEWRART